MKPSVDPVLDDRRRRRFHLDVLEIHVCRADTVRDAVDQPDQEQHRAGPRFTEVGFEAFPIDSPDLGILRREHRSTGHVRIKNVHLSDRLARLKDRNYGIGFRPDNLEGSLDHDIEAILVHSFLDQEAAPLDSKELAQAPEALSVLVTNVGKNPDRGKFGFRDFR